MAIKILIAPTEDFIKSSRTQVSADVSAGSSVSISVANANGFAVNDFIVVGPEGSEQAELCKITAVSATQIQVLTLVLAHKADEPIVKYRYNQRKFYGSLTAGGSYSQLSSSGSPADIRVTDPQGTLLEYTGSDGYIYFKATYYNTVDSYETDPADAVEMLADDSVRYCSIYAIKRQAGLLNNPYINDAVVETYRKRAENEIDGYLNQRYQLPLTNSSGTEEIPFLVENCATLLAAGYMDYQEFGKDGEGVKWLGEARSLLKKLQTTGGMQLIGSDHAEMTTKTLSSGVTGYPDSVDNANGPTRFFTRDQKF